MLTTPKRVTMYLDEFNYIILAGFLTGAALNTIAAYL
jgi:hypothetical protein